MFWKKRSIIGSCGNPTGMPIRNDAGGKGYYGAPRVKKLKNGRIYKYLHKGTDYQCVPGQIIKSPMTGIIKRIAIPYEGEHYSGVLIDAKRLSLKMFYFQPFPKVIGKIVKMGDEIGMAQDISEKYKLVTPHIHVQVIKCDAEIFIDKRQEI